MPCSLHIHRSNLPSTLFGVFAARGYSASSGGQDTAFFKDISHSIGRLQLSGFRKSWQALTDLSVVFGDARLKAPGTGSASRKPHREVQSRSGEGRMCSLSLQLLQGAHAVQLC